MWGRIKGWYNGTTRPYENEPGSPIMILGFNTDYHWTALVVRAIVQFYLAHWKWVWTTMIAVAALFASLK